MVTVPDKLKPLFPSYRHRAGVYARRRPSKRLKVNVVSLRIATAVVFYLAAMFAAAVYMHTILSSEIAVSAYINGQKVAFVSDPGVIREAVYKITLNSTNLSADFDDGKLPPVTKVPDFDFQVSYRFALTGAFGERETSSVRECTDKLFDIVRKDYTYAFIVFVDSKPVAASQHYSDAAGAVERIEELLTNTAHREGEDIDKVRVCSTIKVQYGLCDRTRILSPEGLYNRIAKLLDVGTPVCSKAVSSLGGENFAVDYGVSRVITENGIPVTSKTVPVVLTENIKIETETRTVDYKTRYVESEDYFVGETFVETQGRAGTELVTYDLVMDGGEAVRRRIASRETVVEPVDEIIVVGIRPLPPAVPTGTFDFPVALPYSITSHFGEKRAEFDGDAYHYGVDFAGEKGDPVYAADGGTVIYTGYSPSYGLMIKLDHGNGFTTVYAHCSKLLLEVGDKVYKGRLIAYVGDTGTTTGTHLHFEIRKNGAYQNPLDYLEK